MPELWKAEFDAFDYANWTVLKMNAAAIQWCLSYSQRSASLIPESERLTVANKIGNSQSNAILI